MNSLREELASYAHDTWSRWMKYLFSKSTRNPDGSITIPPDLVSRWERQMTTYYSYLSEDEKESDRKEADAIREIVQDNL